MHLRSEVHRNVQYVKAGFGFDNIIGKSPQMMQVISSVKKVAASEASTVLIQGQTGTGKDLVARALHYESLRSVAPFSTINCRPSLIR